jgi:hypothetical protein
MPKADPNLYRKVTDSGYIYVGVLVDNCLILPSDKGMLDWFMTEYRKHYTLTGGEPVVKFNGVHVEQHPEKGVISFHLKSYIEQVYRKYVTAPSRTQTGPIAGGTEGVKAFMNLKSPAEPDPAMADKDFNGLIGCMNYIVTQGRPDCSFHVSWLGQFRVNPPLAAWHASIVVLVYLYNTRDLAITYGGRHHTPPCDSKPNMDAVALANSHGLMVWSDASWGDARTHGGHIIMYMGGAICWVSRLLKVVAQSTTEAETAAGVPAAKDLRFVRHILTFLGVQIESPTPLLIDNEGMWFNVRNEGVSQRTRYWELWLHFVREMYLKKLLTPLKVHTDDERADIMTKAMPKQPAEYFTFRDDIMNVESRIPKK